MVVALILLTCQIVNPNHVGMSLGDTIQFHSALFSSKVLGIMIIYCILILTIRTKLYNLFCSLNITKLRVAQ